MADCDNDQECEKIVPTPIKPEPLPKQCSGGDESGGGTNDFNELENRPKYGGRAMTGETNIPEVETYEDFVGTDGEESGTAGLVPAPEATDVDKFLKSDGTWAEAGGGSDINVVQTAGTSPDDVMSQKATTEMIYSNASSQDSIKIGAYTSVSGNTDQEVAIGSGSNNGYAHGAKVTGKLGIAVGYATTAGQECLAIGAGATANPSGYGIHSSTAVGADATCSHDNSVALGKRATTTRVGELNVGTGSYNLGYNSTPYRVIGGVHDGQDAHDAVNVEQINALIDAFNTATGANISHIGA